MKRNLDQKIFELSIFDRLNFGLLLRNVIGDHQRAFKLHLDIAYDALKQVDSLTNYELHKMA